MVIYRNRYYRASNQYYLVADSFTKKDEEQVVFIPTCLCAFILDTKFQEIEESAIDT